VLALSLFASGVGELQAALDRFFRGAVKLRLCEEIAAGPIEYLFPLGAALCSTFYARHCILLFSFVVRRLEVRDSSSDDSTSSHAGAATCRSTAGQAEA